MVTWVEARESTLDSREQTEMGSYHKYWLLVIQQDTKIILDPKYDPHVQELNLFQT